MTEEFDEPPTEIEELEDEIEEWDSEVEFLASELAKAQWTVNRLRNSLRLLKYMRDDR